MFSYKSNKVAKIRNRYNQVPHLTQDKSLASGALFLGILVNADNKLMDLCYRCYIIFFISYLQMSIILKILRYK